MSPVCDHWISESSLVRRIQDCGDVPDTTPAAAAGEIPTRELESNHRR